MKENVEEEKDDEKEEEELVDVAQRNRHQPLTFHFLRRPSISCFPPPVDDSLVFLGIL